MNAFEVFIACGSIMSSKPEHLWTLGEIEKAFKSVTSKKLSAAKSRAVLENMKRHGIIRSEFRPHPIAAVVLYQWIGWPEPYEVCDED